MTRTVSGLGAVLAALLFAGTAHGGSERQEVEAWLLRMADAVQNLEYEGVFVYLHSNQLETVRVIHTRDAGRATERLISLNGVPREVVRENDTLVSVQRLGDAMGVVQRPLGTQIPQLSRSELERLHASYHFRVIGRGRVAERFAKVIALIPRDTYRYGYRLYLDEETGLPLKSDLMDESAEPIEQIMFTQLNLDPAREPTPPQKVYEAQMVDHEQRAVVADIGRPPNWGFRSLPEGFAVSAYDMLPPSTDQDAGVEHITLSDGLASLSIYVEKGGGGDALEGLRRIGAVSVWGGDVQGHQVTVVGEVPPQTLEFVVGTMRLLRGPQ